MALGCSSKNASKYVVELKKLVKDEVDERKVRAQSRVFRALSDPTRLKILKLLNVREMCVCEIMVALGMTQPTASHHLGVLENAGLITHRRRGRWVFYSLSNQDVLNLLKMADRLSLR